MSCTHRGVTANSGALLSHVGLREHHRHASSVQLQKLRFCPQVGSLRALHKEMHLRSEFSSFLSQVTNNVVGFMVREVLVGADVWTEQLTRCARNFQGFPHWVTRGRFHDVGVKI